MEKIAVVRLDKIGDLILTTPAIASLRASIPEASITAIVSGRNKAVLEHSTDVGEVWEWRRDAENLRRLKEARFDQVIVFSPTTESYKLAFGSHAKIRAGYIYRSRVLVRAFSRFWLNRRLVCEDLAVPHEVDQNLELVRFLMGDSAVLRRDLAVKIGEQERKWAAEQLPGNGWVSVHLARSWMENLPSGLLSELLLALSELYPVFVTYGPDERSWASSVSFSGKVKVFGDLTFQKWGALLQRASVCVSTNTGAVHLAASQKVPVVAVFEPKLFAYHSRRWSPWQVPNAVLRKDDPALSGRILDEVKRLIPCP